MLNGSVVLRLGRVQRGPDVEVDGRALLFGRAQHRRPPLRPEHLLLELVAVVIGRGHLGAGVAGLRLGLEDVVCFLVSLLQDFLAQFTRLKDNREFSIGA